MGFNSSIFKLILLINIVFVNTTLAQNILCNGSLGDPVIKIDFGRGSAHHGNAISETSFLFEAAATPRDSWYTIAKSTTGMHPNNWHQIGNHTPNDPDGYMMIVNASEEPSIFYEATIQGLCPNTTYEFAAWVINLMKTPGNKPNLTFTISTVQNVLLATYNTGNIPESSFPNWLQPGFLFTTPANVGDIVISIRNNGPGGNGNDIAIDDITFSACGPVITSSINGELTSNKNLCVGEDRTFILSAEPTPGVYNIPQYLWQEMDANGVWVDMPTETGSVYKKEFIDAEIGSYKYRVLVAETGNIYSPNCRTNSPVFELKVNPFPIPVLNPKITVCLGDPINLSVNNAASYKWKGPLNFTSNTQSPKINNATADMAGIYYITIANAGGCEASAQVEVTIVPRPIAFVAPVVPICKGSSTSLNASGGLSYRWEPAAGLSATNIASPLASPTETTLYTVYVSNGYCETSTQIKVEVIEELKAMAGTDFKIILGNSVQLKGSATGENIEKIFWTPSDYLDDPTKLNPIATPPVSTTYTLNVTSSSGCISSTDQVFVKVYEKVVVPNSFSPNGDGINDSWNVIAIDAYINPLVKVMNRYGQLMFESSGEKTSWDGKHKNEDLPVGVYYYIIYLEPDLKPLSGSLTLIR